MSDHPVKRRKKLIEVAIPLEAINAASAREKSIRHGHPSTLHLWWARRPLAAARAVIFCQMVDDPSAVPEEFPTEEAQENERLRLFALISELVTWENTTNEEVLNRAREEIRRSWRRCCSDNADHPEAAELFNPEKLPGFHDPFAGGGALPLEAQRLGLEAYASDLNPVAVLINKAMIEIPPKFAGMPPINPDARSKKQLIEHQWKGAEGLAEDVRYYGKWMREEAEKRVGHLYPMVEITPEIAKDRPDLIPYIGQSLQVIAWIWARTVRSPDPSFSEVEVPLASTFMLSKKPGKEVFVEPLIEARSYQFRVRHGSGDDFEAAAQGTSAGKRAAFRCLMSGTPITYEYIRSEGQKRRMGQRLMAIAVEGPRGRIYLDPISSQVAAASPGKPKWVPKTTLEGKCRVSLPGYGMEEFGDLFSQRQLCALNEFADLSLEVAQKVAGDWQNSTKVSSNRPDSHNANEYAVSISIYLACAVSRMANYSSTLCAWSSHPKDELAKQVFMRQALAMTWDFAETNPFSSAGGTFDINIQYLCKAIARLPAKATGLAENISATAISRKGQVISTDPPYYDNIDYADLSDFFYVWLRRCLKSVLPGIFSTLATPKADELVASAFRHASKQDAEYFFLKGMSIAMRRIADASHPAMPLTIYYAFKQSETKKGDDYASTGWETFLEALMAAELQLDGTWPIRTELITNLKKNIGALSSSIVIVCRPKERHAGILSRTEFRRRLREQLSNNVSTMEKSLVPPVDMAQAAIGPGMAIFSGAKAVLNPDDSLMSVREALAEINAALDEYLSQDEGELDPDSRFALTFFESFGYAERDFGDAEGLAKARNISVEGVASAGILRSVAGKVWLFRRDQLDEDWDPTRDDRLCVWEATQHLIKRLESSGEGAAAELLEQLKKVTGHGDLAANCRALAYRLYNHCERTKQAEEARAYNGLVIAWPELERLAASRSTETTVQASLI
jgi:putative DNA methylase